MKKLFLTSGLIACMACPAFAEDGPFDIKADNTNIASTPQSAATCQYPTLGVYEDDQTFYAKWKAHVFTVTYNPQFGETQGTSVVKMGNTNTTATAQVTKATFNSSYTVYTDANFANATVWSGIGTENETSASGVPFTKVGYNFAGWKSDYNLTSGAQSAITNISTDGTLYAVSENATVNPYNVSENNVQMYATWTPQQYDMIYDSGYHGTKIGAQTPVHNATYTDPTKIVYDAVYTIKEFGDAGAGFVADTGYSFAGWSFDSEATASDTLLPAGAMSSAWNQQAEGDTLYAIYSAHTVTLTYSCGTATPVLGNPKNATVIAESPLDVNTQGGSLTYSRTYDASAPNLFTPSEVCELAGWHIEGTGVNAWNCVNTDTDTPVALADVQGTWKVDGNVTCSLDWEANPITLEWRPGTGATAQNGTTYAAGEGTGGCTYDSTINVAAEPKKAGYDFQGWTTDPEHITDGSIVFEGNN